MGRRIRCFGYGWSAEGEDIGAIYKTNDDIVELIEEIIREGKEPDIEVLTSEELQKRWSLAVEDIKETFNVRGKPVFGLNIKEDDDFGTLFVCFK